MKIISLYAYFLSFLLFFPFICWSKDLLYVANIDVNLISVIDGKKGTVSKEIPVGRGPIDIAVDPQGKWIAVSHQLTRGEIYLLDRKTLQIRHKVLLTREEQGKNTNAFFLSFSSDGKKLYAVNQYSGFFYVLDPLAGKVTKNIYLGEIGQIKENILSPDGRFLYLPDSDKRKIFVVDVNDEMVKEDILLDGEPNSIAVSPDSKTLYIADAHYRSLDIFDVETQKIIKRIPVGIQPLRVAISKDGRQIFVSNMLSYSITVIDSRRQEAVANIPVGAYPGGIVASPDGKRVYVCNFNENTVSIIDTRSKREIARAVTASTPFLIAIYHSQ